MMEKQIYRLEPTYPVNQLTANFIMNPKPPTIYAILNSIANYDNRLSFVYESIKKGILYTDITDYYDELIFK